MKAAAVRPIRCSGNKGAPESLQRFLEYRFAVPVVDRGFLRAAVRQRQAVPDQRGADELHGRRMGGQHGFDHADRISAEQISQSTNFNSGFGYASQRPNATGLSPVTKRQVWKTGSTLHQPRRFFDGSAVHVRQCGAHDRHARSGAGPEDIDRVFRKWLTRLPLPLRAEDREAGYGPYRSGRWKSV
jgi:hypothetical protein